MKFVLSNFNTDPERYFKYTTDILIYDQSTDKDLANFLYKKYNGRIIQAPHTGNNQSDYFRFFLTHWEQMPEYVLLGKGNMIGRHITEDQFNRVWNLECYTFLFSETNPVDKNEVQHHLMDGWYLEINNSWYLNERRSIFFDSFNHFLKFTFVDPIIPKWTLFAPGNCYIVPSSLIKKRPKVFWMNLLDLVSYQFFPGDAYIIERAFNLILNSNYELSANILKPGCFRNREIDF
jgi:hypothetical protein